MIDIIIPAYNAHKTLSKTLISVSFQTIVDDINVYVVNDGSDSDYKDIIGLFKNKLKIKELKILKNSGPGVARNYGISKSNGDYLLFLDSDDVLYDCYAVANLLKTMNAGDYDVVHSNIMEVVDNKRGYYFTEDFVLHGKLYKRSFIESNNICFPDLYNCEDVAFENLMRVFNARVGICNDYSYVYMRRSNSLTFYNGYLENDHVNCYANATKWTYDKLCELGATEVQKGRFMTYVFAYFYYYLLFVMYSNPCMEFVFDLIPLYDKVSSFVSYDEKVDIISIWTRKFEFKMPIDVSYEDFINFCRNGYNYKNL